ncbi:MAG: hypothetical protein OSJ60_07830 [Lachnospiraceae bacterium]|nr:hypothetical protein [Lachnospiraceae bacterium]
MTQKPFFGLTAEEMNTILICTARNKNDIITELKLYLGTSEPDIAEILHNTIEKVYDLTEEELAIIFME